MEASEKLLVDAVRAITELKPGQVGSDAAKTAFNSFRKGVTHATANTGNAGRPGAFLGDLEPKGEVLHFLVDFHAQRRIFRKQIVAVFDELLNVDSWWSALNQDTALCAELPEDLLRLLTARQGRGPQASPQTPSSPSFQPERRVSSGSLWAEGAAASSKAAQNPISRSPDSSSARPAEHFSQASNGVRRQRLSDACMLPIRVAETSVSGHILLSKNELDVIYELLEQGRTQMASLDFSAADADKAISAFETFRRAVQQAVPASCNKQGGSILEKLEPKGKILDFLVDMYERHQKYRSRVTSTLTRLLNVDSWNTAADRDGPEEDVVQTLEPDVSSSRVRPTAASTPLGAAGSTKWTPWGPAVPSMPSSPAGATRSTSRSQKNPFAPGVTTSKSAVNRGAFDVWTDLPSASVPRQRPNPQEAEVATKKDAFMSPAPFKASMPSGPWGPSPGGPRPVKPTNPFGPAAKHGGSPAPAAKQMVSPAAKQATNPFKIDRKPSASQDPRTPAAIAGPSASQDLRTPAANGSTPQAGGLRNPFAAETPTPAFVPNAQW